MKRKPKTQSEIIKHLCEQTGLPKRQVKELLGALSALMVKELIAAKQFTIPGMIRVKTKRVEAKPARKGINPFTKAEQDFKAKPAYTAVKAAPVKALKEAVK